jgi:hypothetical protein
MCDIYKYMHYSTCCQKIFKYVIMLEKINIESVIRIEI